jgi:hypothetical protein
MFQICHRLYTMKDLPPNIHAELDAFNDYSTIDIHSQSHAILFYLFASCRGAYADVWPLDSNTITEEACIDIIVSRKDILDILRTAHATGKYAEIRQRRKWHLTPILVFTHSSSAEFHVKKPEQMFSYFEAGQRYATYFFL